MSWYTRRAGPILRERLEELRTAAPDERHSLADEVDLARLMAQRNVAIYDTVVLDGKGSDELQAMATAGLRGALNHVSEIVSKAARVHVVSSTVIELEHIDYVLQQVTRIIEEEVADKDKAIADAVINRIAEIKLPEQRGAVDAEDTARELRSALSEMDTTIGGQG